MPAEAVGVALARIAAVAPERARGADTPPFATCHSEFHPTSIHIGAAGLRILDWARSYTGRGLFDLVSWQGTQQPLDLRAVAELIDLYVACGGPAAVAARRGGLPAHVWAAGWDRVWIVEWYMRQAALWQDPTADDVTRSTVERHLREATECLI